LIAGQVVIGFAGLMLKGNRMITVEEKYIDKFTEAIYTILKGDIPALLDLPTDYPDNEIKQFTSYLNNFITEYKELSKFMYSLARGELGYHPPKGKMVVVQSFKALQSNLRHLTWKTQQIAHGDFDQKVDFIGDLSESFNIMTDKLNQAFREIEEKNKKLEVLNKRLQKQTIELKRKAETLTKANQKIKTQRTEIDKQRKKVTVQRDEIVQQNIKLINTNATKDKFFSILSHDLRVPFNNIYTATSILIKNYKETSPDNLEMLVSLIHESSKQSIDLLDNLLTWANTQSGKFAFKPQKVDLHEVVLDNIFLYLSMATIKNISLVSYVEEKTYVFIDNNMIKTVIRNLISNALKFTPANGKVSVYSSNTGKNFVEVKVVDTGMGIKTENQKKLFRTDVHFTTLGSSKEQGTGLGLILCKEFVERNGGSISVKSQVNKGSSFIFTLPVYNES
jgi:signal transduction histidine kinase